MAKRRKTYPIKKLIAKANMALESSKLTPEQRYTLFYFVADILHETGNYRGFNYIDWYEGGIDQWKADGKPKDTEPYLGDQSKRFFYYS